MMIKAVRNIPVTDPDTGAPLFEEDGVTPMVERKESHFPCRHIDTLSLSAGMLAARRKQANGAPYMGDMRFGHNITLMPDGVVINVPHDYDVVYVLDDANQTTNTYRWPPSRPRIGRGISPAEFKKRQGQPAD